MPMPKMRAVLAPILYVIATSSCGGGQTPGAEPHDMSTSGHEAAASREDDIAAGHANQYDPTAPDVQTRCGPKGVCWTSAINSTADHKRKAEEHRKMAADHRAAAAALTSAEDRVCVGIPPDDRDMSPFAHTEDIAKVELLGDAASSPRGVTVVFRTVPGLTVESLQQIVDCHLARNEAVGGEMKEMPYCPLVPKGVVATVAERADGIAVAVESSDPASAAEVVKRAQALVGK